jgi:predicted GIY-YIG superfamily endonuclease
MLKLLSKEISDALQGGYKKTQPFVSAYIFFLTKNSEYKESNIFFIDDSTVNAFDKIDNRVLEILKDYNVLDFLFNSKDSALFKGFPRKDSWMNQDIYDKILLESFQREKLKISSYDYKISYIIKNEFKKETFLKSIFGKSYDEKRFLYEHAFATSLKNKLILAIYEDEYLIKKFGIDNSLILVLNSLYTKVTNRLIANGYGESLLRTDSGGVRQRKQLIKLLSGVEGRSKSNGYIYAAYTVEDGKWYVGQTIGNPEKRFLEHRKQKTGPFRTGQEIVSWSVLEANVSGEALNAREAYWIKQKNAYTLGHNMTKGNS